MSDLISIILPAYNAEKFLTESVGSILAQTHSNIELIVVNDGSIDGTMQLANQMATEDARIKVINQQNQGVSAARNNGLKTAEGNYIGFIDADDLAAPDLFEFLFNNLEKYNADISHCGFELVKFNKKIRFHGTGDLLINNKNEALKELLSGKKVEPGVWNKLYRKSVLTDVFFPTDIKVNEDLLFNILAFNNSTNSVFEDVVKYQYQFIYGSASRNDKVLEHANDMYKIAQRIKAQLTQLQIKDEVDVFYAGKLLNILKTLRREKLFKTDFALELRKELKVMNTTKMGLRIRTLKSLLVNHPFLYDGFIQMYNVFFVRNQKWKQE